MRYTSSTMSTMSKMAAKTPPTIAPTFVSSSPLSSSVGVVVRRTGVVVVVDVLDDVVVVVGPGVVSMVVVSTR